MTSGTILRLAVTGGTSDRVRIGLTIVCASLASTALFSAAIVASIPDPAVLDAESGQGTEVILALRYSTAVLNDPGLRPGIIFTLLVLVIPVLFLVGQAARFGAPDRDRRLAAFRMAGATPGQVARIVAVETALATLAGVVIAIGSVALGRILLDDPNDAGVRPLPTDVPVPIWSMVTAVIVVPLLAAGLTALALRRVRLTPFGVLRRRRTKPPRSALVILLVVATGGLLALGSLRLAITDRGSALLFGAASLVVVLVLALALVVGSAALSSALGSWLVGRVRRPSWLVAARRLVQDPFAISRSLGALFVAVFVALGVIGTRDWLLATVIANSRANALLTDTGQPSGLAADLAFHQGAFDLVQLATIVAVSVAGLAILVALIEQVVSRRRTLAALVAAGTPRAVLARAGALQVLLPLVPGVALSAGAGWLSARAMFGWQVSSSGGGYETCLPPTGFTGDQDAYCADPANLLTVPRRDITIDLGVPWPSFLVLGGGALAGVAALTMMTALLVRVSTDLRELRAT